MTVLAWGIMDQDQEPDSITLFNPTPLQRGRAWTWCRQRCGPPWSEENPDGTWMWTELPGLGVVITLPSREDRFEMRLVEPWNA